MHKKGLTTAQVAFLIALLTVITKVFAFVREMFMANYFGAGVVSDAFVMSQSIITYLLSSILSAVGTAYMPALSQKNQLGGAKDGDSLTSRLMNFLLIVSVCVVAAGVLFAEPLVGIFAPGFDSQTSELTVFFLRILFVTLFSYVISSIIGTYLNYKNIFLPQVIYLLLNNIILVAAVVLAAKFGSRLLIIGPLLGQAEIALFYLIRARRAGYSYSHECKPDKSVKSVLIQSLPVFAGGYVTLINLSIDRIFATDLVSGTVSALNYSNQIINSVSALSVGIFVTMLYPKVSKAYVQKDYDHMTDLSEKGVNVTALLAIPFSMGMICYAPEIITIVYARGAFDAAAVELTSGALACYAAGFFFVSMSSLITKVYYSMNDTMTSVKCSAVGIVVNIALNFLLVGSMGHKGLALATSAAQLVQMALLVFTFGRRYKYVKLTRNWRKLFVFALLSATAVGLSRLLYGAVLASMGRGLVSLLISIAFAALVYLVGLIIIKCDELKIISDLLGR